MNNSTYSRLISILAIAIVALFVSPQLLHALPADTYAASSRLASGNWVKVKVTDTGICAITSADASRWGFKDLSKVRVFGYGGAQLSEKITDYIDDLPQVPVMRDGGKIYFYAKGTVTWRTSSTSMEFEQVQNPYSTAGYYFITDQDGIDDLLVSEVAATPSESQICINSFTDKLFHEEELYSPGKSGRYLIGEDFLYRNTQSFNFTMPGWVSGTDVSVLTVFYAKNTTATRLSFKADGVNLPNNSSADAIRGTSSSYDFAIQGKTKKTFTPSKSSFAFSITADCSKASVARLDYITVNYQRQLSLSEGSIEFVAKRGNSNYELADASATTHIWDVTTGNVRQLNGTVSGTTIKFCPDGASDLNLVAFDTSKSKLITPSFDSKIANQNIHAEPTPDMIILAPSEYLAQARRVAALHEKYDNMRVLVLDHRLSFNEFSSGKPDAMAYRHLCKLFYDRGADAEGHKLGYLLLMGTGSFDNRRITSDLRSLRYPMLLTWENSEISNENSSYVSDDPFVILDDNSEVTSASAKLSIAVGRMPVKSVSETKTVVDKLEDYITKPDNGAWKTNLLVVADDMNNGDHMVQSDKFIGNAKANGGDDAIFNRVYLDAFTENSDGSGRTYPEARTKFHNQFNEGAVWVNYIGHAYPYGWTAEKILTYTDITNMYNRHLPIIYTATCEFTRFDALDVSGGEYMYLNPQGGAIALISATRAVIITNNGTLNAAVGKHLFNREPDGSMLRMGEIIRRGKNDVVDSNRFRYCIFGDPAMRMKYPSYHVELTGINGKEPSEANRLTFQACQQLTLTGRILDTEGNPVTDFNGSVLATLYDTEQSVQTHGYGTDDDPGLEYVFQDRTNKLAINMGKVENGSFTMKMLIPSEVISQSNFDNYRTALMSLYAYSDNNIQAVGSNDKFYIYGYDESATDDGLGPDIISMGINGEESADGVEVNESPLIMAKVSDKDGINFSNGGLGHQMSILLDEKTTYNDVANYYTATIPDDGAASAGSIAYPLSGLSEGDHTVRLKVWDVFNNSSERTIAFKVVKGLKPEIYEVYTSSNPAIDEAKFYLKHNRPESIVNVTIEVFDLMGRQVWSATQTGRSNLFTSFPITWDLNSDSGARVPRGIYVYRATISTDGVTEVTKSKKIAVAAAN